MMTEEQAVKMACEALGEDDPEWVVVDYSNGHSGVGWYAWPAEYPEEGSVFLDSTEAA